MSLPNSDAITGNPVHEILMIYKTILDNPRFDEFQKHESMLDQLYIKLDSWELTEEEKTGLREIQKMHEQIIRFIVAEKESLSQEMFLYGKKKRAANHYNTLSNSYDAGAFFMDFRK
ncbi:hypothetical protein ACE3NQ_14730 [Paenibacillus terreus]|uniref:Flagellar protein FliT n=1 Tax=Paenibacillus terreus TaxID=1387834 RepID=A0ABV5B8Z6_9BACL